jgi:ferritin-like metal-binding protein YciE
MALKIITSWTTLFRLAHASGQAKLAHLANPSPETEKAYDDAVAEHDRYRDMCLEADEMIGLPDISDVR